MSTEQLASNTTTRPRVGESIQYSINYTIGHANVPAALQAPTNYCSLSLTAVSDTEAVSQANDQLLGLEFRLGSRIILKQEIQLGDGWHYFSRMQGIDSEARAQPGLESPTYTRHDKGKR